MTEIYDFKPEALLAERPPEVALPYDIQLYGATDGEGYFHLPIPLFTIRLG